MHLCCGDLPFVFHGYKDPQWFYQVGAGVDFELYVINSLTFDETRNFQLEKEFYPTNASARKSLPQYRWRNSKESTEYFDRVRKAMKDMT